MKNKKIWGGIVGLIVFLSLQYLSAALTPACCTEETPACCNTIYDQIIAVLYFPIILFLVIFLWGIIELVIRKYKAKI